MECDFVFCRFGPTKRHDPRWDMLGILYFNGMFGIFHFDGMPDFVLTFGTAKPTDVKIVGLVPPNAKTRIGIAWGILHFNSVCLAFYTQWYAGFL